MRKFKWKTLLFYGIVFLAVLGFAYGLAVISEAVSQGSFENFQTFRESDTAPLILTNLTVLLGLLIYSLYFLTTKLSVSIALVGFPYLSLHLINAFKLTFRNEPFYPWDISLAGEAANIAGSMKIELTAPMVWGIVFILSGIAIAIAVDLLWQKKSRPRYRWCLLTGAVTAVLLIGSCCITMNENYLKENGIDIIVYAQSTSYKKNGFIYSFMANIYESEIDAPADYSQSAVTQIVNSYHKTDSDLQPNVIIMMSEAFADIWNAENLTFEQEVAPNFTALAERYLSGSCLTSEYGGNTSNCEFEVLTGYSTYLLPSGTVPYMNYLNHNTDSYVSFLKNQNYYTVAIHPYLRTFFSREKAYGLLGFDNFYSEDDFENAERVRSMQYISDDAVVDRIIEEYEKTDQPFFCHTVTMQNHASFFLEDWPVEEKIDFTADCELSEEEYNTLRSYVTGIHSADEALGKLISYFESVDEPTVILFFGDHQPSLYGDSRELMERIGYTDDRESEEGLAALQSTPYLIWNNFEETPTHAEENMSMFHLLPYMTRTLGLSRPGFHAYMDTLYEEVRAVTRNICLNAEEEATAYLSREEQEKFDEYLMLVYDGLIGKKYGNLFLYPQ